MVTKPTRKRLYLAEWMAHRSLSDQALADKVGVDRVTVTRWREQQHRLNPDKMILLAGALDTEPGELWHPPGRRVSLDAMTEDLPDDLYEKAAEVVAAIIRAR